MLIGFLLGFLIFAMLGLVAAARPGSFDLGNTLVLFAIFAGGGAAFGKLIELLA